jgi:hypothetical protein
VVQSFDRHVPNIAEPMRGTRKQKLFLEDCRIPVRPFDDIVKGREAGPSKDKK